MAPDPFILELASTPRKHILEQNNKTQSVLSYPQTLAVSYWNIRHWKTWGVNFMQIPLVRVYSHECLSSQKKRADSEKSNKLIQTAV